jgi:radical SAM protein with 4Fe4S-binding SPASM domain
MTLDKKVAEYKTKYTVSEVVDLDHWHDLKIDQRDLWLRGILQSLHQEVYTIDQRILLTLSRCNNAEIILERLQYWLYNVDISSFFIVVLSNDPDIAQLWKSGPDMSGITFDFFQSEKYIDDNDQYHVISSYNNSNLIRPIDLDSREEFLLKESKTFCIYPWIHLHSYPTGDAYPCCHAEMKIGSIGNSRTNTLEEIWNSPKQRQLRQDMLSETSNPACKRCYEQEDSGFFSGRRSANKHHGHHINRVKDTQADGTVQDFKMTYWDIRFSNLCNLSCRSCGHIFSSNWYQDQAKLAGGTWKDQNQVLNYAGRTETDMWEQLIPHLDYVEQIYFAGGEPLMMKEHYNILDELERRGRFDVRLIYNTNFTHIRLKDRTVFDYWKKFQSVSVGASLDAMGPRAEYIRKGTDWATVESNRRQMLEVCPEVDFYISPTLSIMNALHLTDFHLDWVNKGLIKPMDLSVNILQDPAHYRIDIAPQSYKDRIHKKFQEHLEWLRPLDPLQRATVGFESAIKFMMATDNSKLIPKFWEKTFELDRIRKESVLDTIPELDEME